MLKKIIFFLLILSILIGTAFTASAETFVPYDSYEYNKFNEVVVSPSGYLCSEIVDQSKLKLEIPLSSPSDIYYDGKNSIYILDSVNGRIVELDKNFGLKNTYGNFRLKDSDTPEAIKGAEGFTVDSEGTFYIADTMNERVLVIGRDGIIKLVITRPDEALVNTDFPFQASKVSVDEKGNIYVIAKTINMGMMVFDKNGEFQQFFGNTTVVPTAEVILNYFRKKFLTRDQLKGIKQYTAMNLSNLDVDENGFIYTVTADAVEEINNQSVRRVNFKGDNILEAEQFGDAETADMPSVFIDVDVAPNGMFFSLVDKSGGKIFQYTIYGDLVSVFGGYGDQKGTFKTPTAIETIDDKVLILDSDKNSISVFAPSEYGAMIREAYTKLYANEYTEALELWEQLREKNTNSKLPYYGMGLAYDALGKYEQAMSSFKTGGFQEEYSESFAEFRKLIISKYFFVVIFAIVALIAVIAFAFKILFKKSKSAGYSSYSELETKKGMPFYVLLHPLDGFEQFRRRDVKSIPFAVILVIGWIAVEIFRYFCVGFCFNSNRASDFSLWSIIVRTAVIFLVFVVSNWCIATFMDGKGKFKDIFCVTAYSLTPYIAISLLYVLLSNVLAMPENVFLWIVTAIALIWSFSILLAGLITIHQYSFSKLLLSLLLTVIGMGICLFFMILIINMAQMVVGLVSSVMSELALR